MGQPASTCLIDGGIAILHMRGSCLLAPCATKARRLPPSQPPERALNHHSDSRDLSVVADQTRSGARGGEGEGTRANASVHSESLVR